MNNTNKTTRGKFFIEFPEHLSPKEVDKIRDELFRTLARYSCRVRRIDDE